MALKNKPKWTYKGDVLDCISKVPDGALGFIYKINDRTNGRYYVGRKNIWVCKKSGKVTDKESNWKSYEGSSKELKEVIKSKIDYDKEILQFAFTKTELTILETKEILCGGALEDLKSYNSWVSCKIYKKNLKLT